ncbi:MAG: T9SS type A sorting domain-containing protein, partial [Bacteroidota bacterium]
EEIANNGIDEDCNGEDLVSAIHEIDGQLLDIYPNPSSEQLWIQLEQLGQYTARLYSITGQLQRVQPLVGVNNQLWVGDLENGIYLLEIGNEVSGSSIVEKIQVLHP